MSFLDPQTAEEGRVVDLMTEGEDGWTDWVHPGPGYRTICCDCGSIHKWEYAIVPNNGTTARYNKGENEGAVIVMRARRVKGEPKPKNIEAIARELHDVAFTYAHTLPAWEDLPRHTQTWFRKRAASGIETRSAIDSEAGVARKGESPTAASGDAQ